MASSAARARVLAGYRRLNRARISLFQGDSHAMTVSRQQMKTEFIRNRDIPAQGPEWEALVAGIDEAADMLTHEIVRGELDDQSGRYSKSEAMSHYYPPTIILIGGRSFADWDHELTVSSFTPEMKIKKEHVKGSDTGETNPTIEPITEETYNRMANPPKVEVCKSSSSAKK